MRQFWVLSAVLLLATGLLFAQGFNPGFGGGNAGQTLMVNTAKGLFVLRGGSLAKFDAATLKLAQIFELFGPAPAPPAQNADRDTMTKYYTEMQRRAAPAIMVPKENSLLIVVGDGFAKINQDTLKVEKTADLRAPGAATADAGNRSREGTPGYLVVGDILYLVRNTEMLAISTTDGKVTRAALPKELQIQQRGGGNNGGARGGGGGG